MLTHSLVRRNADIYCSGEWSQPSHRITTCTHRRGRPSNNLTLFNTNLHTAPEEYSVFIVQMHCTVCLLYRCTVRCVYCTDALYGVFIVQMHCPVCLLYRCTAQCVYCTDALYGVFIVQMHCPVCLLYRCTAQCVYCTDALPSVFIVQMHCPVCLLYRCTAQCVYCTDALPSVFIVQMHCPVCLLYRCTAQCVYCTDALPDCQVNSLSPAYELNNLHFKQLTHQVVCSRFKTHTWKKCRGTDWCVVVYSSPVPYKISRF